MNLVFERDIPALQGKTWRERIALRRLASTRDRRIVWRPFLFNLLWGPLFVSLMELRVHHFLPSLLWVGAIYFAVGFPLALLAYTLWINPLIEAALHPPLPPSDEGNAHPPEFDY